ncbi:HEPN domain-containing protein [Polaribacter sp. 20A6]|uniref:HEPN domain-containing protein n=1 Tax=Polaribacter sp. 20A6 TaxID=2687289 RepID=UPI0013FD297B|nr:HEPN domain-containing protein [Polaribacter sp. 20A6]
MKKKYILFSIINSLKLDENTSFIIQDWTITNNKEFIIKNIPNVENLIKYLGESFVEKLLTNPIALKIIETSDNPNYIIHNESSHLNGLLSMIWMKFDNCIGTYTQCIQSTDGNSISSNFRNSFVNDAKGSYSEFHLTSELINQIDKDKLVRNYEYLFRIIKKEKSTEIKKAFRADLENDFIKLNRIQRSFLLLNIARTNSFLPMKIAFYINVLECILLDVDSELSLRLRLNASNLIGENKKEKELIMSTINKAYSVRSKFFHGSEIKLTKEKLENLSSEIDDLTRRIIIKSNTISEIINTTNTNIRDDYFKSILFT